MKVKLSGGKLDLMGGCGWSFFIYHSRRGGHIRKGTYFKVSLCKDSNAYRILLMIQFELQIK